MTIVATPAPFSIVHCSDCGMSVSKRLWSDHVCKTDQLLAHQQKKFAQQIETSLDFERRGYEESAPGKFLAYLIERKRI